ncbi:UPF0711 protein C18orf21 homolog isoform X2 [Marmota monax]|uniref:UPF0711 protein C18orf21 homolog isoform X2 n=3 Tax=Marmota TaxID=9992 RepID=UPI0026EF320E|nr:UPF0711 protein C18orf21 homolog isoform X2 [Marmota monax]
MTLESRHPASPFFAGSRRQVVVKMRQKHYLEAAARNLVESCPGQARYLLWAYSSSHDDKSTFEETCPYCFQLLVLDNSRVRLKPKAKLTPRIQKLLNREARNNTLSFKEAKIVKKYKDSKSVLLITCKTCNRTVKHHGKSRSFLSTLKSSHTTPTSKLSPKRPERQSPSFANFTPNMPGSKGKSPALIFRTPTSGQSTPICSSRSVKKGKKHFSQLKMLLSQNESQKNSKVDFRNFLSSL